MNFKGNWSSKKEIEIAWSPRRIKRKTNWNRSRGPWSMRATRRSSNWKLSWRRWRINCRVWRIWSMTRRESTSKGQQTSFLRMSSQREVPRDLRLSQLFKMLLAINGSRNWWMSLIKPSWIYLRWENSLWNSKRRWVRSRRPQNLISVNWETIFRRNTEQMQLQLHKPELQD